MTRIRAVLHFAIVLGLLGVAAVPRLARADFGVPISLPVLVSSGGATTDDIHQSVATDGDGRWIAVWESYYTGIMFSISDDEGRTWSPATLLSWVGANPSIATDGSGTWVVALGGNYTDVHIVRSTDDGVSWSTPQWLRDYRFYGMSLSVNDQGTWIVAYGADALSAMSFQRSTDGGATWSPVALVSGAPCAVDPVTRVVPGGGQTWVIVAGSEIYRSADDGVTWTEISLPIPCPNPVMVSDVATDGLGNWLAVWDQWDDVEGVSAMVARSVDDGLTWSTPVPLPALDAQSFSPGLAADGRGNWIAAWLVAPVLNYVADIAIARSTDMGQTWTAPQRLLPDDPVVARDEGAVAYPISFIHEFPAVTTDGRGHWLVTWESARQVVQETVIDWAEFDILASRFTLPFVDTCAGDLDGDGFGQPGDAACPLGAVADCDDGVHAVGPGALEVCDGANNDCNDPLWPALPTSEQDGDGDGRAACQDCSDSDPGSWATPAPARDLLVTAGPAANDVTLSWLPPASPGTVAPTYDVLRAESGGNFVAATVCVETNDGTDTLAVDNTAVASGTARYYLVRVRNSCPASALGHTDRGARREGRTCP